jgi:hypothetical protein
VPVYFFPLDIQGLDNLYNEHNRKDTDIYKVKRNTNFETITDAVLSLPNLIGQSGKKNWIIRSIRLSRRIMKTIGAGLIGTRNLKLGFV